MKFDKFTIGDIFTTKQVTLTKEEILQFGNEYDPQYFHVDEDAAKESSYGSLIASGFQTLAVIWREWIKMDILSRDCLGGVGMDIKWTAPVVPNDQLVGQFIVDEKKESSKGDRGLITFDLVIKNQAEQEVLKGRTKIFISN